jgi:peroxiredoxin
MKLAGALTAAFVGMATCHLNVPLARCEEPNQKLPDRDEEIYGKHTIGPKSPTPLNEAVVELNRKVAEHRFNSERPVRQRELMDHQLPEPLTVEEVLEAIRNRDPETYTHQNQATPLLEGILKTRILPPHSVLTFSDRWISLNEKIGRERRIWRIEMDMMTGKNQGASFLVREQELDMRRSLKPRPGFHWIQEPRQRDQSGRWVSWFDNRLKVSFGPKGEALVVNITRSTDEIYSLHVIAFDENWIRYDLDCRATGADDGFVAEAFRLDPACLRPQDITYVGIEGLTREHRAQEARHLAQVAGREGGTVLPLPKINEAYSFVLTTADGKIDSAQLRGKVVLIFLWASSSAPCLEIMPEMKEQYAKWHDKGLAVIGVSLDADNGQAQAVVDRMQLPWPSSTMPPDCAARKHWDDKDAITTLPTILIVDAKGILKFELANDTGKLAECVKILVSASVTRLLAE